jgi:hypothetical protein
MEWSFFLIIVSSFRVSTRHHDNHEMPAQFLLCCSLQTALAGPGVISTALHQAIKIGPGEFLFAHKVHYCELEDPVAWALTLYRVHR